jgi:hypothetical protein
LKNDFSRETAGPRCRAAIKISRVIWRGERPRSQNLEVRRHVTAYGASVQLLKNLLKLVKG